MTSNSEFGPETTATEVAKEFSKQIAGKNVLITGISEESIGGAMALAVASQNPNMVILASRTKRKIDAIADKIQQTYPSVSVKRVQVDFASQESVRAAAADINGSVSKLDILINNAGMMTQNRGWTKEHLELQFGTNHVGPFLFTNLLLNKMLQAASEATPGSTRIINVSSFGHRLSPIRFHDYNLEGRDIPKDEQPPATAPRHMLEGNNGYSGFIAHGQSKTANILFSVYLTHLLQSKGILSFSIHPGSIWTGLSRDLNEEDQAAVKKTSLVWKNHDQGAATALVAAFDPSLSSVSGGFMSDCQFAVAADHATSLSAAQRLWELSEELTGCKLEAEI